MAKKLKSYLSLTSYLTRTSFAMTVKVECRNRSMLISHPTGKKCGIWLRTIRSWLLKQRTAGMCQIQTRRAIWRSFVKELCSREFEEYKQAKKKLKVFRLEAVRAGFKKAWQERDYATIIAVAEKIPNNVLEEDPKLLMWYDQAVTRMGSE